MPSYLGRHVPRQRLRLYPPALTRKLLRPPYGRAASAPGPPGKEFATLTSTLRPSGRCRRLRYAARRPVPNGSALTCRAAHAPALCTRLQAGPFSLRCERPDFKPGAFTRPALRSVPRKKGFSSGASPPEYPFLRSTSRAVFATLTCVRPTRPRPRRGQASRLVSFFRYAPERDLSRCLLAGGRSVPAFHRASRSSRQAPP